MTMGPLCQVYGEEVCPGLKAGGKINWIRRTIPCVAPGARIPKGFEVDVRSVRGPGRGRGRVRHRVSSPSIDTGPPSSTESGCGCGVAVWRARAGARASLGAAAAAWRGAAGAACRRRSRLN